MVSQRCVLCRSSDLVLNLDIAASGDELVCSRCGAISPVQGDNFEAETFGRHPSSSLVWGGGNGTNYATRNSDGSSDTYAFKGDNGKYAAPVTSVIAPYEFQNMQEPDSKIRAAQQRLSQLGEKNGFKDEELSLIGEPIMGVIRKVQDAKKHLLVDARSNDTFDPEDPVLFKGGGKHFLSSWLKDILENRR